MREAKKSPRITVGELQKKSSILGSPSLQNELPSDATSMQTDYLVMAEKNLPCDLTTWSLLEAARTLTGTVFYGQIKRKLKH